MPASAIYTGWVGHRRFLPVPHGFNYRLFMMYLDLDELPTLFDKRWFWSVRGSNLAWFKREDYYGDPGLSLRTAIADLVHRETGRRPTGPIRLLTHMRYFGHCFNPVSFYFCHELDGRLAAILCEVRNTPWRERHHYVLPVLAGYVVAAEEQGEVGTRIGQSGVLNFFDLHSGALRAQVALPVGGIALQRVVDVAPERSVLAGGLADGSVLIFQLDYKVTYWRHPLGDWRELAAKASESDIAAVASTIAASASRSSAFSIAVAVARYVASSGR